MSYKNATAKEPVEKSVFSSSTEAVNQYINKIYNEIDFKDNEKLSFEAFSTALHGYLNLLNEDKVNYNKQILTIADLSLSANVHRLWIIDLKSKKVLLNDYVAHGQGSGEEFATAFSNRENSHQTSLGFYVTGDTYIGDHGRALRLYGLDEGFNSAAFDRDVVVHGADYVCPAFIKSEKRLGRSWGCPAVSNKVINKVIDYIEGGTCLFIYYPQKKYLSGSVWLKKKVARLPEDFMLRDVQEKPIVKYVYAADAQEFNPESPQYVSPEERKNRLISSTLDLSFIKRIIP